MQVRELLKLQKQRELVTIVPSTTAGEAMELLISNKIGCLPVMGKAGELLGILDDKDIFRAIHSHHDSFEKLTSGELMTSDLIIGVLDDDLSYIAGLMGKNQIRYIPIMDKNKMVGLISPGDVVKAQMTHIEIENRYLKMYMEGTHPA